MRKREITEIGIKIKQRLIELNMTQRELAEMAGITENYIHQIIYGYRKGIKFIGKIEHVLDMKTKNIA